ncbi:hypothetical protein SAMN05428953_101666 [Mesorhizobium muleiense]|uniref:Uncharacterized protein n=1 Tax=Mesorhizobium muleiense TaxID=1004279 RepID=A0A1G8JCG7_9HYPH|nr:hypothetical protein [Mesorhizobium muleiense]SDI28773.1 hypothetical protein SAMN05428953_101666 [Mesorhizobium muleiense]
MAKQSSKAPASKSPAKQAPAKKAPVTGKESTSKGSGGKGRSRCEESSTCCQAEGRRGQGKSSAGQEAGCEGCGKTGSEESSTGQGCARQGKSSAGQEAGCKGRGQAGSEESCACQDCTRKEGCAGKESGGSEVFGSGEESSACGQTKGEGRDREGQEVIALLRSRRTVLRTVEGGCRIGASLAGSVLGQQQRRREDSFSQRPGLRLMAKSGGAFLCAGREILGAKPSWLGFEPV